MQSWGIFLLLLTDASNNREAVRHKYNHLYSEVKYICAKKVDRHIQDIIRCECEVCWFLLPRPLAGGGML
jgi:hypothetical protein